jgi:hypothetical protein
MVRLRERRFRVRAPLDRAWAHSEYRRSHPAHERHPVHLPDGGAGPADELEMFLWILVHYDHRFRETAREIEA